jgi:uncharacterized HAD superfamily protein
MVERLGLDIDEVQVQLLAPFLEFYNGKYGTSFCTDQFHCFDWWTILNIPKEQAYEESTQFISSRVHPLPLIEGVSEAISQLSRKYELHTITDRRPVYDEHTHQIIALHSIPVDRLHYASATGRTKAQVLKSNQIPRIIEDNAEIAHDCAQQGIDVILLDQPWNRSCQQHPNIQRKRNWTEICEYLL